MNEMLVGAIAAFCFVIGLFFLRFWKNTRDKFFFFFALSFLIESANRVFLGLFLELQEAAPAYYMVRLLSYALIVYAIVQKNKQQNVGK